MLFMQNEPKLPCFQPKNSVSPNSKPIKANSNPIQTQFFGLKMNNLINPVLSRHSFQRRRIILSKNTVLICVNQCLNIIRVTCPERPVVSKVEPCRRNSWNLLLKNFSVNSVSSVAINKSVKSAKSASKINAFYAKRTQTSSFSTQKQRFTPKTNPKQTQTKPMCKIPKINLYPVLAKHYEKIQ